MNRYIMIEADHSRTVVGLWCDNCDKPSVVGVPILAITEEGVDECGSIQCCIECGEDAEDDEL